MIPKPATSAPLRNFSVIQILKLHSRPTESESLGVQPSDLRFNESPKIYRYVGKFENCLIRWTPTLSTAQKFYSVDTIIIHISDIYREQLLCPSIPVLRTLIVHLTIATPREVNSCPYLANEAWKGLVPAVKMHHQGPFFKEGFVPPAMSNFRVVFSCREPPYPRAHPSRDARVK